jgi:diguanylate cyclase (GGDEF)-like protein/PAS domain S-box-containing protein
VQSANYPGAVFIDLLEQVSDGVYLVNNARQITYWNTAATRLTGYAADEVLGRACSSALRPSSDHMNCELCQGGCPLAGFTADGMPRSGDLTLNHKDGHIVAVTVRGHALTDPRGQIVGTAEVFSERPTDAELDVQRRSLTSSDDPVTGLPLRSLGEFHLSTFVSAVAAGEATLGLLFIDVDNFKDINDTYGHPAGDRVLRMVGQSMATALRRADVPIRWGGEEFVALLPGVNAGGLTAAAERGRMRVANSWVDHEGTPLKVTVSVGACLTRPGESPEDVVGRADRLMYQSKNAGRNRVTTDADPANPPTGPDLRA